MRVHLTIIRCVSFTLKYEKQCPFIHGVYWIIILLKLGIKLVSPFLCILKKAGAHQRRIQNPAKHLK